MVVTGTKGNTNAEDSHFILEGKFHNSTPNFLGIPLSREEWLHPLIGQKTNAISCDIKRHITRPCALC